MWNFCFPPMKKPVLLEFQEEPYIWTYLCQKWKKVVWYEKNWENIVCCVWKHNQYLRKSSRQRSVAKVNCAACSIQALFWVRNFHCSTVVTVRGTSQSSKSTALAIIALKNVGIIRCGSWAKKRLVQQWAQCQSFRMRCLQSVPLSGLRHFHHRHHL